MKLVITALGIIILLVGFGLIVYNEKILTHSEPTLTRKAVPRDEVESMKKQGWEEVVREGDFSEEERVLMIYEGTNQIYKRYYIHVFPYQVVGLIVSLIGFVTMCIGFAMEKGE